MQTRYQSGSYPQTCAEVDFATRLALRGARSFYTSAEILGGLFEVDLRRGDTIGELLNDMFLRGLQKCKTNGLMVVPYVDRICLCLINW